MRHQWLKAAFWALVLAKLLFAAGVFTYGGLVLGGSSDADYYHAYALGEQNKTTSLWPVLLRLLSDAGLYNRLSMQWVMVLMGGALVPLLAARVINHPQRSMFWCVAIGVGLYPTLFFYSLDIYREAFMCLLFLFGVWSVQRFLQPDDKARVVLLLMIAIIAVMLYYFRPYLGAAFILAFLGVFIYRFSTGSLWLAGVCYLFLLNVCFAWGAFEPLFKYRSIFFGVLQGDTNLGYVFDSSRLFIVVYLQSAVVQLMGFYFNGPLACAVFMLESLPLLIGLMYVLKHRAYSSKVVDFLMLFFVIYATFWLLGNDNYGTAVRLRVFNYLAVFMACALIGINKRTRALTSI